VAANLPFDLRLTPPARRDIAAILKRSRKEFGLAARERYEALMVRALEDISHDPERPGTKKRSDIAFYGCRTYHLSFSRTHVAGVGVKEPRHFLIYRHRRDLVIEVLRVLHDARDLARHLAPK